ncbi:MAG: hypothetical protein Q4C46_05490 [Bacillota bacterium]|nr:hypothetical protein [Bacillota bacterium]
MKLSEVIEQVKKEKPNSFGAVHCTLFISEVESMVQEFLKIPSDERIKYIWERDGNRELVAPDPYSALYISYLKGRIDYSNEEYQSYANNQAQFIEDFNEFKSYAVREGKIRRTRESRIMNWW